MVENPDTLNKIFLSINIQLSILIYQYPSINPSINPSILVITLSVRHFLLAISQNKRYIEL